PVLRARGTAGWRPRRLIILCAAPRERGEPTPGEEPSEPAATTVQGQGLSIPHVGADCSGSLRHAATPRLVTERLLRNQTRTETVSSFAPPRARRDEQVDETLDEDVDRKRVDGVGKHFEHDKVLKPGDPDPCCHARIAGADA